MLKLWAEGLGIPQRLFNNDRVKTSIEANDPHGMISDMRRILYDNPEPTDNLNEACSNLHNAMYQLEAVFIFQQYPNEIPKSSRQITKPQTVGWASEHEMLDGM